MGRLIAAWLESPSLSMLVEGDGHWPTFPLLAARGRVRGGLVHDVRIAAIRIEHGVRELWTADRDFSRFAGLKAGNPMLDAP